MQNTLEKPKMKRKLSPVFIISLGVIASLFFPFRHGLSLFSAGSTENALRGVLGFGRGSLISFFIGFILAYRFTGGSYRTSAQWGWFLGTVFGLASAPLSLPIFLDSVLYHISHNLQVEWAKWARFHLGKASFLCFVSFLTGVFTTCFAQKYRYLQQKHRKEHDLSKVDSKIAKLFKPILIVSLSAAISFLIAMLEGNLIRKPNYGFALFLMIPFSFGLVSTLIYSRHTPRTIIQCIGFSFVLLVAIPPIALLSSYFTMKPGEMVTIGEGMMWVVLTLLFTCVYIPMLIGCLTVYFIQKNKHT